MYSYPDFPATLVSVVTCSTPTLTLSHCLVSHLESHVPPRLAEREETAKEHKKEADGLSRKLAKTAADLTDAQAATAEATRQRYELQQRLATLAALEAEAIGLRAEAQRAAQLESHLSVAQSRAGDLEKLYRDEAALRKKYWNMMEDMKGVFSASVTPRLLLSGCEYQTFTAHYPIHRHLTITLHSVQARSACTAARAR